MFCEDSVHPHKIIDEMCGFRTYGYKSSHFKTQKNPALFENGMIKRMMIDLQNRQSHTTSKAFEYSEEGVQLNVRLSVFEA